MVRFDGATPEELANIVMKALDKYIITYEKYPELEAADCDIKQDIIKVLSDEYRENVPKVPHWKIFGE